MSLIQEALRRREEEEGKPQPSRQMMPPPLPEGDRSQPTGKSAQGAGKAWLAVVTVIFVILAMLGAAFWLFLYAAHMLQARSAELLTKAAASAGKTGSNTVAVAVKRVESVKGTTAAVTGRKKASSQHRAHTQASNTPVRTAVRIVSLPSSNRASAARKKTVRIDDSSRVAGDRKDKGSVEGTKSVAARVASAARAAAARHTQVYAGGAGREAGKTKKRVVGRIEKTREWPDLMLAGVVMRGNEKSAAIINGEVMGVDEYLMGVRLVSVEPGGVWLEYGEEKKFLRIGRHLR